MFLYVMISRLILFIIVYAILAIAYAVFTVLAKQMPDKKWVTVTQRVLSLAMFFNVPLGYFMLVSFDLTISALLTIRNADGLIDDSWSMGDETTFRTISVILAWAYLIVMVAVIGVLIFVILRAEDLWAVSNRIGFIKFGVRFHSKRPILVFLIWFFALRFLFALTLSLDGILPDLASGIIFCLLVVASFVICVVNRLFKSLFLYLAMCVMELFLVYIGV